LFTETPKLHKILILRNMHDRGGGDIPIIVTAWSPTETDIAMKYWKELSAGEWSEEEEARQCRFFLRSLRF
jgi:hypothetical protein